MAALEKRRLAKSGGLDLSNVTLRAILKYPRTRATDEREFIEGVIEPPPKFGVYDDESTLLETVQKAVSPDRPAGQSLEASIMDIADDIAYAIHDLEDFYQEGFIDFDRVQRELEQADTALSSGETDFSRVSNAFLDQHLHLQKKYEPYYNDSRYIDALQYISRQLLPLFSQAFDNSPIRGARLRTSLSDATEGFFKGLTILPKPPYEDGPLVALSEESWHRVQALKAITKGHLVTTTRVGITQRSQMKALTILFNGYADWISSMAGKRMHGLPQPLTQYLSDAPGGGDTLPATLEPAHFRAIGDYIAGLSDYEALTTARWFSGTESPGLFALR
jgi:dGTPase